MEDRISASVARFLIAVAGVGITAIFAYLIHRLLFSTEFRSSADQILALEGLAVSLLLGKFFLAEVVRLFDKFRGVHRIHTLTQADVRNVLTTIGGSVFIYTAAVLAMKHL